MIIPMKYTHFGYTYLQKVTGNKYHPGIDLNRGTPGNADLGDDIKATTKGKIVHAEFTGGGWGNLIVIYHPELKIWSRYGHLQDILVEKDEEITEGQLIGHCGNTGGNWSPHLHFDIIIKELSSWRNYTNGWTLSKIKEYYANPLEFIEENQNNNDNQNNTENSNNTTNNHNMPNTTNNTNSEENLTEWQITARNWAIRNKVSNGERPLDNITRVELWETIRKYHKSLGD